MSVLFCFCSKQYAAYVVRISYCRSDVCSSYLGRQRHSVAAVRSGGRRTGQACGVGMIGRALLILDIARNHIVRRTRQTAVAVSGVAVGVGFFLAVSAMMIGSQTDFVHRLIDAAPHIIVSDELRSPSPQPGVDRKSTRLNSSH